MNIPKLFTSFSPLEIVLLVIFTLYIVLPIQSPSFIADLVETPLGMLTIFIVTIYLFFHVNPIIAVVYIFVAYELLRRSSHRVHINYNVPNVSMINYAPIQSQTQPITQAKKDNDLKEMNPPKPETLEEQVIQKMAPIGRSEPSVYVSTSFKPVAENTKNAVIIH